MNKQRHIGGVGGSRNADYRPHRTHYHMHFDCDSERLYYTNWQFHLIDLIPDTPISQRVIRNVWCYCTYELRNSRSSVAITVNGSIYTITYESGYKISVGHGAEDDESWMVYGRPITPYHARWMVNNRGTVSGAREAMPMQEESAKLWNERFWK